jgi:hypothetical protein
MFQVKTESPREPTKRRADGSGPLVLVHRSDGPYPHTRTSKAEPRYRGSPFGGCCVEQARRSRHRSSGRLLIGSRAAAWLIFEQEC